MNTKTIITSAATSLAGKLLKWLNPMGVVPIAVPTVTVIGIHPEDPFVVAVIKHQPTKHHGRRTLVGGKYKLRSQVTPLQQAHTEWAEEAGGAGAFLQNPELWAIKVDHKADVREALLKKATDGDCPKWLEDVRTSAFFGVPDLIYVATVVGTPAPLEGQESESVQCEWYDLRQLRITASEQASAFGAQHDLILKVYCCTLQGLWHLKPGDFENFKNLRMRLLEIQGQTSC